MWRAWARHAREPSGATSNDSALWRARGRLCSVAEKEGSAPKSEARTAFTEGDFVVYPNHGAGCIAGVEEKTILGEVRRYSVVYMPDTELTVSIPADGDDTGLRACAGEKDITEALAGLQAEGTPQ